MQSQQTDVKLQATHVWYMCLCVHLHLPYDCVMIFVLLIPACLFYLTGP